MALEEKQIPYKVEKVNMRCYGEKPAEFTRMQPSGNIPVAVINGDTIRQSNDILYIIENDPSFASYKSLQPYMKDSKEASRAQSLLRLERQLFSAWMYWLTGRAGSESSKNEFIATLQIVEDALKESSGPFFMGNDITMVDIMFAPFIERMASSLLYYKGFQMRFPRDTKNGYPGINAWFDAMEQKPSYQLTKSDHYTHCWDLPPQLGGCTSEPNGIPYENAINGIKNINGDGNGGSWELPLQPHNGGIEPDWDFVSSGKDEDAAKREAVERITANYEKIVKFASRGAGNKGPPTYWAPLSDPLATPSDAIQTSVDHVLRIVCTALLDGIDDTNVEASMKETSKIIINTGGKEYASAVISSLSYLRDRIGVPRDMKLPAARQLRAHLNWSIGYILDS